MTEAETCTADRQTRELESIIESARTTNKTVANISNRLQDMRQRLLGMDESREPESDIKEVANSEISDLRDTLRRIDNGLDEIEKFVTNLETV